jgi:octaprenyl-diphosphate synthase
LRLNLQEKTPKPTNPVDVLHQMLGDAMNEVNNLISLRLQSKVRLIPELASHLIYSGGKRLRPLLTLASAELCNYQGKNHIPLAASVEFIHTATLLHDDVVDQSDLRRGKPSANAIWGNKPSVLVGDFLFSRSFELMVEAGSMEVLAILSKASSKIAEGEVAQLLTTHNLATTQEDYLNVIESKTAQLFAAATRIGPVLSDCDEETKNALENFGLNLGIAFQLVDDVLDYKADDPLLGKKKGNDFAEGKITLPIILAYEQGNRSEQAFWGRTLEECYPREGDLEQAIRYFEKYDTLNKSLEMARCYQQKALSFLAQFDASPLQKALVDLTNFVVERQF